MFDEIDQRLLNRLQGPMPLVGRPWAAVGEELGLTEGAVLARVGRLKRAGEGGNGG